MSDVARVSSGLAPEVSAALDRYARDAPGAYAANTVRAIKSDTALFSAWCAQRGYASLSALPKTLAAFVDAMVMNKAAATVRRYVSSVSHLHRAAEVPNPAMSSPVRLALKRMTSRKAVSRPRPRGSPGPRSRKS